MKKLLFIPALILAQHPLYADNNEKVDKKIQFEAKERGGYESQAKTETLTDSGTKEIIETKENVDISKDGKVVGAVQTDIRNNPSGIMNETWKQEEVKNEINPDGTAKLDAHSKTVNADGTLIDSKLNTESKVNPDGSGRTVSKLKTTVDPKGMLNKKVIETSEITDKNVTGGTTVYREEKVNGEVVKKVTK